MRDLQIDHECDELYLSVRLYLTSRPMQNSRVSVGCHLSQIEIALHREASEPEKE